MKLGMVGVGLVIFTMGGLGACGSSDGASATPGPEPTPTSTPDAGSAPPKDAGTTPTPEPDAGTTSTLALALPQAVDGALWVNPDVYPTAPLRIAVTGKATAVTVSLAGASIVATDGGNGVWLASLPMAGVPEGDAALAVTATAAGASPVRLEAKLGVGRAGMQLTSFAEVGSAGTPRLHRLGDSVYLTYTDRSLPNAEAFLRRVDGAGHWLGDKVPLVGAAEDTLYARAAMGTTTVGVLYQSRGGPYTNHFKITDLRGHETVAPITLDPQGFYGSYGGDVAFDGEAFVAVWRSNNGAGSSQLQWIRVNEKTGAITGPVIISKLAASDGDGGFDPITPIAVSANSRVSVASFVRKRMDALLGMAIPKSQVTVVKKDGTIATSAFCGVAGDDTWHQESRVFGVGGAFVSIWSAKDLNDDDPNAAVVFFGARAGADGALDPARGKGKIVLNEVDDRGEMFLLPHPETFGALAWLDNRSYHSNPQGKIDLYAAKVDDALAAKSAVTFPHARFISGTSELNATLAGTNALLVWLDERHGGGILAPKPEMWMETVWY